DPPCPVSADVYDAFAHELAPLVVSTEVANGSPAFQLDRLAETRELITRTVRRRLEGKTHTLEERWDDVLRTALGPVPDDDADEDSRSVPEPGPLRRRDRPVPSHRRRSREALRDGGDRRGEHADRGDARGGSRRSDWRAAADPRRRPSAAPADRRRATVRRHR